MINITRRDPNSTPVLSISLPEYRLSPDTDWVANGRKLDRLIADHFAGRAVAIRGIGLDNHPNRSLDDLVSTILSLGTDRYDPDREGIWYARTDVNDIHAAPFSVTAEAVIGEKMLEGSAMARVLCLFYEGALADRGYAVRLDILMIYDREQLQPVVDCPPDQCYEWTFKDPTTKPGSLLGIVRILRDDSQEPGSGYPPTWSPRK